MLNDLAQLRTQRHVLLTDARERLPQLQSVIEVVRHGGTQEGSIELDGESLLLVLASLTTLYVVAATEPLDGSPFSCPFCGWRAEDCQCENRRARGASRAASKGRREG